MNRDNRPQRPHKPNADGSCQCCSHAYTPPAILRAACSVNPPRREPADYLWVRGDGTLVLLCSACCAAWRHVATGGDVPVRVVSFAGVPPAPS